MSPILSSFLGTYTRQVGPSWLRIPLYGAILAGLIFMGVQLTAAYREVVDGVVSFSGFHYSVKPYVAKNVEKVAGKPLVYAKKRIPLYGTCLGADGPNQLSQDAPGSTIGKPPMPGIVLSAITPLDLSQAQKKAIDHDFGEAPPGRAYLGLHEVDPMPNGGRALSVADPPDGKEALILKAYPPPFFGYSPWQVYGGPEWSRGGRSWALGLAKDLRIGAVSFRARAEGVSGSGRTDFRLGAFAVFEIGKRR